MEQTLLTLAGSFVIALNVGLLTGIFGVGGGFLLTPALMILLGIPGPMAVGTGLATILTTSSYGMLKRRGTGTVAPKIALPIAAGSLLGVAVGSTLLEYFKQLPPLLMNGREVVAVQYILLWIFLVILSGISGFMVFDVRQPTSSGSHARVGLLASVNIPPYGHFPSLDQPRLSLFALGILGLLIGTAIGLMGIGGGVIMLPALIYLVGQRTTKAAGTSLLLVWISSLMGVFIHLRNGNVDAWLWAALTAGGLVGTFWGTRIGLQMAGARLRRYFVYVILAAILLVGYKLVRLTWGG